MRIVMVSETVGDAFGQERVVRDSTALLRKAGHEVLYLTARKNGEPECDGIRLMPELFRIHTLYPPGKAAALHLGALDFFEAVNPDVVHLIDQLDHRMMKALTRQYPVMLTAHTVAPTCPASGRLVNLHDAGKGSVCGEKSGWRCLWNNKKFGCLDTFKSDLHRIHAIHAYSLKRRALENVSVVAAISRYVEKTLVDDGWPAEKVRLVYNPVAALDDVAPFPDPPDNLIVCAARLVPMKGIDYLLKALKSLEALPWTLWICGDGPSREGLVLLSQELGLESRVKFLGATPFEKTRSILAASHVVVQANLGPEGFGLSVAEASAMGKPVVAFDVPALNEIILHGETGFLAKPKDVGSLAGFLKLLLANAEMARDFGRAGKLSVARRFSPESHLKATLAAYEYTAQITRLGMAI